MLLLPVADALGAGVRLSLDMPRGKRSIAVGDVFYIYYTVADIQASAEKPRSVPGANILYFDRTGQSSSFTSVNGHTTQSSSVTYTLTLRAVKEGSFSFGPVSVGGARSNTLSYTIGAKGSNAAPQQNQRQQGSHADPYGNTDPNAGPKFIGKGDGNLFLRASVSKTSAYEYEALVYTVKLYTSYAAIKFIGASAAPKFEGFVIEESKDVSQSLTYETYKGKTYATAVIARYIIFPQMKGSLKVLGNTYTVSVDEREYYHDPFWGEMSVSRPLQLNVTPNDLVVNVRSLPQPQPANFSGGVGKFSIASKLPTGTLRTNQAASAVYTVTGTGNLKYVKLPELNAVYPPQLEVYSPTTDVKSTVGSSNVSGFVRFDYSFMPLETGNYHIPDVSLVYFNPETGRYETSVAHGADMHVEQGTASSKSQTKEKAVFHPALMSGGHLAKDHSAMIRHFSYWLWYIIPFCLLVASVIVYRRHIKANSDIILVRSRKANKMARTRLRKAAACMRRKDAEHFYDEMLLALWGYLGDKLRMPTSELSRENVAETLRGHGVAEDISQRVIALIDDCEYAKYAPSAAGGNMTSVYDSATSLINELEDAFKSLKK